MWLRKIKDVIISIFKKKRLVRSSIHLTIDRLPAWNYFEILKTGNLKLLIIRGEYEQPYLIKVWEDINYQILDEFDMPVSAKEQIIAEKYLFVDKINYLVTGDRELIHRIKVKQRKLEEKDTSEKKFQSAEKQAAMLQAKFNIDVDLRKMSILRFYHLIEQFKLSNNG